ncbi:Six-hairpin glycosidase [Stereum hirsutum FP-91666 SS1]|uniref:Six-hairpin glycosidase n=1 Tax=Stereum hirsutum (strain FP-91666) TaxID=721885 RepID=UPI000440AC32|nr:Six-hairpin glycosidase [Stereum hirsutum FP-91666 SS1]EIM86910.1 Six-hairpin glycosidase [Stereum hirsutum FP-91666 SS1]
MLSAMLSWTHLSVLLLGSLTFAQAHSSEGKSDCSSTLRLAAGVAKSVQSYYAQGNYTAVLWTDANTVEDIHDYMFATGDNSYAYVGDSSFVGQAALNTSRKLWDEVLGGSTDDAQWVIMTLWKIADYHKAHHLSYEPFLSAASVIYDAVSTQWDDTCGGGLWWDTTHGYKNAITNHLYVRTSAQGYLRTGNDTYLENALKVWTWLEASGMRNEEGLWNDGLDFDTCLNNNGTTWIYNQAVVASGLGALYKSTGNRTLLNEAEISLDATVKYLTTNGVLRETCDDATNTTCNTDQHMFKGLYMKHIQAYLTYASDSARIAKYKPFITAQASAIVHNALNSTDGVSSLWYSPDEGGAVYSGMSDTAGLAALLSAAEFGKCEHF